MYKDNVLHARDHYRNADFATELGTAFDFSDRFTDELLRMREIQLLDRNAWSKFVGCFRNQGCDDEHHAWRCEYWGKMMRGACFTYKALSAKSPDDELYAVLEETVRDMLTTQDELGRFSTYSLEQEFHGWDIWGRKYIMLGFIYFLDICRDDALADEIIEAVKRHADYMIEKLGREEDGKLVIAACSDHWDGLNSCSILEPYMFLYNITKKQRYFDFAEYIISFGGTVHTNFFELAYEDKIPIHKYPETKVYEMISCFEGLAEYVKVTGNEHYKEAIIRFGRRILREEATIIGCLGCQFESFDHAVVEQFNENHRGVMQETCVTVTWMKFLWQLWRMTGDACFMDAFESAQYNAMSAALRSHINMEENSGVPIPIHSYNPLRHDIRFEEVGGKQYIEPDLYYGCCVCISSAGYALNTLVSAGQSKDGLYINLFRTGTITTKDITLTVNAKNYASEGKVSFRVDECAAGSMKLNIRFPQWAYRKACLHIDGTSLTLDADKTEHPGYYSIFVKEGSEFMLEFPLVLRYIHPKDVADTPTGYVPYVAVRLGPQVYALDETFDEEPAYPIDDREGIWTWELAEGNSHATEEVPVPCRSIVKVPLKNGEKLTLVDYPSAGQEKGHKVCAWIKMM